MTASAAPRYSAVKLTTNSYMQVTFHIRLARKVQKYGDAFSKSSIIFFLKKMSAYYICCIYSSLDIIEATDYTSFYTSFLRPNFQRAIVRKK